MLIYIRHAHDEYDDATYAHDNNLTKRGKVQSYLLAKKLTRKYGVPSKIICSPFRRTQQTSKQMVAYLQGKKHTPEVVFDPLLSRYFSSKEIPEIAPETEKYNVPIYEGHSRFKKRSKKIARKYDRYASKSEVVWIITHALVYKRICRYYDQDCESRVRFLSWFVVPHSHEPETHSKTTFLYQARLPLDSWKRI